MNMQGPISASYLQRSRMRTSRMPVSLGALLGFALLGQVCGFGVGQLSFSKRQHLAARSCQRTSRNWDVRCALNVGDEESKLRQKLKDIIIPPSATARGPPKPAFQPDFLEPEGEGAQQLTDRVKRTVSTVRMKKEMFRRYVNDIQGVTGLGAVAAQEYVRKVIEKRQLVWGDLLMIVMLSRPVQTEGILLKTAKEVLEAPIDPLQWVWFRDNLLSTYGWFARSRADPSSFLYEKLLEIAEEQINEQAKLANAMKFPALEGISSEVFFPGGKSECRQDHRMVGNVAGVLPQLLGTPENLQFYDLNVYLNQLLCIANVIDPQFQGCVSELFSAMDGVEIQAGPPKNLARSRAKAQTDYAECPWPTCAHLLDLVRCSITFETPEELKAGLELLMREAGPANQEGPNLWSPAQLQKRMSIVRIKNGFSGGRGGYRDIKVNVIFVSEQGFAMIGEVALVLAKLRDYKNATHELYEILREREFFRQVVEALGDDWV